MKHLWHLIIADVRRFRLLLAVWLLVLIMDTAFGPVQSALADDQRLQMTVGLVGTLLFLARWLGMIVIVPLVVQTHPLVGSTAFWMTRPIPWRTLCASKIVLLGVTFVAAPAACEIALMLICRVPAPRIALVAMQMMVFHAPLAVADHWPVDGHAKPRALRARVGEHPDRTRAADQRLDRHPDAEHVRRAAADGRHGPLDSESD